MAEFKFKSSIRTIDLSTEDSDKKDVISIDVGNKELMKKWISETSKLEKFANANTEDTDILEALENAERGILDFILGEGSFDRIMIVCNNNLFSVISFIKYLSDFLNKEMESFFKSYV